jgi:hypothetical protein
MITAAVDHDENGVAVTGTPVNVWSNVNPDGTPTASSNSPTYHCAGWTAAGMQGYLGHATDIANGNWTQSNSFQACTVGARLYCFQQQ